MFHPVFDLIHEYSEYPDKIIDNRLATCYTYWVAKENNMTKIKATILFKGGMGEIVAKHVWLLEHGRGKYAQYNSAVYVKYLDKGARKPKGFWLTYNPYLVILDGWQDIKSQSIYGNPVKSGNAMVSKGQYQSYDPRWVSDFEEANPFTNIIADYRGINAYDLLV